MRIVTFRDEEGARLGLVRAGRITDLAHAARLAGQDAAAPTLRDMLALIAASADGHARVAALGADAPPETMHAPDEVELLAPIPRPRKNIFCVGRNYEEHATESQRALGQAVKRPAFPNIFSKAPTTVTGPYAAIPFDASVSSAIDWEAELGVVIGRGGRHIARADALAHVWGYTVLNDVTARDIQHRPGMQWFLGKNLDGFCPMGPLIVTADEIPDPQRLEVRCAVNGVEKQRDTTAHMLFDIASIIETLSRVLTLEPGDIIATGTPSGVGFARTPPEYLKPGDVVKCSVAGIGTLRNTVVPVRA